MVVLPIGIAITVTHKARSPVHAANLDRPYERVSFRTSDGLKLAGWYVPSRNRAAVIAFPGRVGPVQHARMLAEQGYGVLLFDRRGEGESEVAQGNHTGALSALPAEYERRVTRFFDRALLRDGEGGG